MDNNQNFNMNNGQPQMNQQMAQPQMPNNNMFAGQYGVNQPKQPSKFNVIELLSIILAGVGFLMVFLGTILTCTCSASKFEEDFKFGTSPVCIITIIGILLGAAAVVLAIMALKKADAEIKADKLAKIAIVLGGATVVFGILPLLTICGYNCALAGTDMGESMSDLNSLGSLFR